MKKTAIIITILVILSFVTAFYLYPKMPDKMASHWNTAGEVDSYMSKFWGSFLLPIVLLVMVLLFTILIQIIMVQIVLHIKLMIVLLILMLLLLIFRLFM